jgi:putative ABC transport system ATP-binding protein
VLEAKSVSKSYRLGASLVTAIENVSLSVASGELIALKGPSGSGKTTLLNLMALLDRPDHGVVRVGGVEAERLDEDARSDLRRDQFGFIFQGFNLIPVLSAAENVSYPMALKGVGRQERRQRAIELLQAVGIGHKHAVRPDLLSGGERQRVAIARALANGPRVVFADEATANLDSRTADEVLRLMRTLNESQGVAFLLATHDPRVVARAHRVVHLQDGRILDQAP